MATFLRYPAEAPTPCAHPLCDVVVQAGDEVFPARLRESNYCSTLCRERDTRRLVQERRRQNQETRSHDNRRRVHRKYGISPTDWDALLDAQGGKCPICQADLAEIGRRPATDHDHQTGMVRGILCHTCNVGIGYLQDDPEIMRRAAEYVLGSAASAYALERGEEVKDSTWQ